MKKNGLKITAKPAVAAGKAFGRPLEAPLKIRWIIRTAEARADKAEAEDALFLCGASQPVKAKSLAALKNIPINLLLAGEK